VHDRPGDPDDDDDSETHSHTDTGRCARVRRQQHERLVVSCARE
jgi:hypothetical protein